MKKFINNLTQSLESVIKIFVVSKWRNNFKIDESAKNEKCIILGNGPSFSQSFEKYERELLENDTVCVNTFATSKYFDVIQPKYCVTVAKIIFIPFDSIPKEYQIIQSDIFRAIQEKVTWKMYMIVPFIAKKSKEFQTLLSQNKNVLPIYFNTTGLEGFNFFTHFLFNRKLGMPRPHNVLIPSIMNMIHLNYKEIYIIGADHSWLGEISVNEQNEALVRHRHFYSEDNPKPQKMMDYIKRPRRLHEILNKFYLTFRGYWEIQAYADTRNVKIYNCSEESMIDAFERKKLSDM